MGSRRVSGGWILLVLALSLLILPFQWVFASILAASFHELCHFGAIRLVGGAVRRIHVGVRGAQMDVCGLSIGKELFCALAGPMGGLLLLFAARWLPRTAVCAGFQSLFNLLPIYPLDGGRAMRCGAKLLLPLPLADKVCGLIEWICLTGVILLGAYGSFVLRLGLVPLLLALSMSMRVLPVKIPCKPGLYSVQ